jgi:peptidoglycan/LPS O-acetylase OafA/YrhL
MNKAKNFRPDINALRALAVVLVLLFHFFPTFFPGGYLGVDIFFVISGYLMFSVIEFGLKRHQFSVAVFYKKRILRILPALACMIAIVLTFAYFLLFSSQFESAVKESLSASLFLSNYYYFSLADYFDSGAYEKLFLHTWTLGVEFQFYLTFPLLLILCSYLDSSKAKFLVLLTVCFLSFVFSEYVFSRNASLAFYDVISRYWEFLLGAIAASIALDTKIMPRIYLVLCICAIVLSVLLHNMMSDIDFFLKFALVVATAVLTAFCNSELWLVKNKAVQHIGTYSYSIYLWHWPIACFLVSFGYESVFAMVAGLISSLVIGGLSFKYLEKSLKIGFSLFALVLILSATYIISPDFKMRVNGDGSKEDQFLEHYREMKIDPDGLFGKCNLVSIGSDIDEDSLVECLPGFEKSVFVWGDSQAASLVPGLKKTVESCCVLGCRITK